jgi:hypothetical protein
MEAFLTSLDVLYRRLLPVPEPVLGNDIACKHHSCLSQPYSGRSSGDTVRYENVRKLL